MKKKYFIICVALLTSLFIYLFYRTDRTVVNEIVIRLFSIGTFTALKAHIVLALPLNNLVIYSLPEGLWVFCITLTSKPYYVGLGSWRIDCIFMPLIFSLSLELLQLLHITNGRFDFMDIGVSILFWLLGRYALINEGEKQNIFTRLNFKAIVCLGTYCIVYLAHVVK